jgi:hypothetical protein
MGTNSPSGPATDLEPPRASELFCPGGPLSWNSPAADRAAGHGTGMAPGLFLSFNYGLRVSNSDTRSLRASGESSRSFVAPSQFRGYMTAMLI